MPIRGSAHHALPLPAGASGTSIAADPKNRKADLAKAMGQAFAAGDPPLGLSAEMHAPALAWEPLGFAAFDTGRVHDEPDDTTTAEPEQAAETSGAPANAPPTASAVESIDPPAEAARAAPNTKDDRNGHATPDATAASEPVPPPPITARMPEPPMQPCRRMSPERPARCPRRTSTATMRLLNPDRAHQLHRLETQHQADERRADGERRGELAAGATDDVLHRIQRIGEDMTETLELIPGR